MGCTVSFRCLDTVGDPFKTAQNDRKCCGRKLKEIETRVLFNLKLLNAN